jgi:hypothetical protein
MNRLLGAVFLVVAASEAYGSVTVQEFEKVAETEEFQVHIAGVAEGFGWANTVLDMRKQQRLYCAPAKLALHAANHIDIIRQKIKKITYTPDTPVELVLLAGLAETFPCQAPVPHPKE